MTSSKLTYFLGNPVSYSKANMFLSQQKYAGDILKRAKMENYKSDATPTNTNSKLNILVGDLVTILVPISS